mgnify:CR=1 FL=1
MVKSDHTLISDGLKYRHTGIADDAAFEYEIDPWVDAAVGDLEKRRLVCADVGECRLDELIGAIQGRSAHARATLRSKIGWKTSVLLCMPFVLNLYVAASVWPNGAATTLAHVYEGKAYNHNDHEDLAVNSTRHLVI